MTLGELVNVRCKSCGKLKESLFICYEHVTEQEIALGFCAQPLESQIIDELPPGTVIYGDLWRSSRQMRVAPSSSGQNSSNS